MQFINKIRVAYSYEVLNAQQPISRVTDVVVFMKLSHYKLTMRRKK